MAKKWIQKAIGKHKRGSLHKQLGVPMTKTIPKTLLAKIKASPIGQTVKNPSKNGKRRIKVTRLLKKRAVLAYTLRKLK